MSDEMFSLKWNGHQSTFFDILATAREKKTFCDATIACEGSFYPVHRFVISTCSTYFESILEDVNDTHPVIVLADIKSKDIEDLLQYMYTGEVKVLHEDIDSLIKAGEGLKIKGLGVADDKVADENEKTKRKKRIINGGEERPEKRQRTDESKNSTKLKQSSKESKHKKEAKRGSKHYSEDLDQNKTDGFLEDPISVEVSPVKEEMFDPGEDSSLYFPETSIKEEFDESLMEEDKTSADCDKFETSSDVVIRQDYDKFTTNPFPDASTSRMTPGKKLHMDWIAKNDSPSRRGGEQRAPLTGQCLVCGDTASGYHYGIETCEGCKAFFKRSTRNNSGDAYVCNYSNSCDIHRGSRGSCKSCRFRKCLNAGMETQKIRPDRSRGGSHGRRSNEGYNYTKTGTPSIPIAMIPQDYEEYNKDEENTLEISNVTSNYEDYEWAETKNILDSQ